MRASVACVIRVRFSTHGIVRGLSRLRELQFHWNLGPIWNVFSYRTASEGAQGGSSVGRGLRLLACPRESNILYIALAGDA